MNEITLDHISNLSDIQLSKLLHTLIELEAEKYELQEWDRSVPFNITTADAGSDGRIEWNGIPPNTKWIRISILYIKTRQLIYLLVNVKMKF